MKWRRRWLVITVMPLIGAVVGAGASAVLPPGAFVPFLVAAALSVVGILWWSKRRFEARVMALLVRDKRASEDA